MNKRTIFFITFLFFFTISTYVFIYVYPRLVMARAQRSLTDCTSGRQGCAPFNTFGHVRRLATPEETIIVNPNLATPEETIIVNPNNDTLYSSAWLDLRAEPLVIHIPDMHGRYYSLQFLDTWTQVFGYKTRRNSPGASDTLIVGPQWKHPLPVHISVLKAPTSIVWIIGRILVSGPQDLSAALALQDKLTITPLSTFLQTSDPKHNAGEFMKKSIVINVLSKDVYNDCHIKGSVNVPLPELEKYAKNLNKDDEIIVYCAHYQCAASRNAWKTLHDLGFTNVKAYEGGMREWHQLGFPTEGACKAEYLRESSKPQPPEKGITAISAQELQSKIS